MSLNDEDFTAFGRRIRPHFDPALQDAAEELAQAFAQLGGGARVKALRPDTPLQEILSWLGTDSLDDVEAILLIEAEVGFHIPDSVAARSATASFRELVLLLARKRGGG